MDGGGLALPFRSRDQILVGFWALEFGPVTSPWTPSLTLVLVLRWGGHPVWGLCSSCLHPVVRAQQSSSEERWL